MTINIGFIGPGIMTLSTNGRVDLSRVHHDKAFSGVGDWQARWTLESTISLESMRSLAKDAGVHIYHDQDDAFYAGNGFLALHAQTGGKKTVTLDKKLHYREVLSPSPIEGEGDTISFDLKPKETRCFAIAP